MDNIIVCVCHVCVGSLEPECPSWPIVWSKMIIIIILLLLLCMIQQIARILTVIPYRNFDLVNMGSAYPIVIIWYMYLLSYSH